jgi:type-F conjugative transfer system pilin assembly protein TrbC
MPYFKCVLLLTLFVFSSYGWAGDEKKTIEQELLESNLKAEAMAKSLQGFGDALRKTRDKAQKQGQKMEWIQENQPKLDFSKIDNSDTKVTNQKELWDMIETSIEQGQRADDAETSAPGLPDNFAYVFISYSMPDAEIKSLFTESLSDDANVVFVFRGWQPPYISAHMGKLRQLVEKLDGTPKVIIDPTLFRDGQIDTVPSLIKRRADGVWSRVDGIVSIIDAVERIAEMPKERFVIDKPIGRIYEIREPDIIEIAKERVRNYDWNAAVEKVKKKGVLSASPKWNLPPATKDVIRNIDPTITITKDIPSGTGQFIARKGLRINPLRTMNLGGPYIVFNPDRKSEYAKVKEWIKTNPYSYLMVTHLPTEPSEFRKLETEFYKPVKPINKLIVKRFQLEVTPTLIEQDGFEVKLTSVATQEL